jgi:hypothetical protein
MNLFAGIIVTVVGLILALLSILRIVPNLTWTGVALVLLGILVVALSFIKKPELDETPRMSTAGTL